MAEARLGRRGVVAVSGDDGADFLQGLVTADIEQLPEGGTAFGALLSPQGKILFDFLVHRQGDTYLIDLPAEATGALIQRLGFYKLRSRVEIADVSGEYTVLVEPAPGARAADPRLDALGSRRLVAGGGAELKDGTELYDRTRIDLGVAESWRDFATGEVFPHEANFDSLHGVNLSKGCYVGQEVVSRMHHRGSARKRYLSCRIDGETPEVGAQITAEGRAVGVTGSAAGGQVLALLRLDRIGAAIAGEMPLLCGKTQLWPKTQNWGQPDHRQGEE